MNMIYLCVAISNHQINALCDLMQSCFICLLFSFIYMYQFFSGNFLPYICSLYQRSLYNAWVTTEKLRESVRAKRIELQLMRQTLKLISILKGQVRLLLAKFCIYLLCMYLFSFIFHSHYHFLLSMSCFLFTTFQLKILLLNFFGSSQKATFMVLWGYPFLYIF